MLNKKIVSLVATTSFVILTEEDGNNIFLHGSNLLTDSQLISMVQSIKKEGYTLLPAFFNQTCSLKEAVFKWYEANKLKDVDLQEVIPQVEFDIENGSTGLSKLITKLSETSNTPKKNQEIVNFISRSRMPLTSNGHILGFRRVTSNLRDNHTGKIIQKVGSIVHMKTENVNDDSRACSSNGLHVASVDYLYNFVGDVLQAVLVEPENIVAVPYSDPTKMRVSKYHILRTLTDSFREIKYGTDILQLFQKELEPYINGFIPVITSSTDVDTGINTPINYKTTIQEKAKDKKSTISVEGLKQLRTYDEKADVKSLDISKVKRKGNKFNSLYDLWDKAKGFSNKKSRFIDLRLHKRKQKQSWITLGATQEQSDLLTKFEKGLK